MKQKLELSLIILLYSLQIFAQNDPTAISIPMRDGNELAADLYLPEEGKEYATILIQTPYNKNFFADIGLPMGIGKDLSRSEYAFVVTDWRCFFQSQSACKANPNRGEDGYDTVEWIAAQEWSNGKVGTWGPSALGNAQFETAREKPPHLVCAVPIEASPQLHFNKYFPGGVLRTEYVESLITLFGALGPVLNNPYYNLLWEIAEAETMFPQDITVPMLLIGGWFDHNIDDNILWFDSLRSISPAGPEHRLLIGPWTHGGTSLSTVGTAQQGQLRFPEAAQVNNDFALRFFDYYLLDRDNGWEKTAPVYFFQMGDEEWLIASEFPPVPEIEQSFYLQLQQSLIREQFLITNQKATFTYDPTDPSPTIGGKTLSFGLLQGPYDQTEQVESRNDVVAFTTPPLTEEMRIKGKIRAELYVSSDQKDTDFAARLTEVYPDGRSMLLGEAIQRMRFRNGFRVADTSFMKPDEVYRIELEFDHLANTFRQGHQVRLIISSSNYPRYNRNMNSGEVMYPNSNPDVLVNPIIAENTIHFGPDFPSKILLPIENDVTTSLSRVNVLKGIRLAPNPTTDYLQVTNLPERAVILVRDILGKPLKRIATAGSRFELPVNTLGNGIYLLQVQSSEGKTTTRKFVVSR